VRAAIDGTLRGMVRDGLAVSANMKIGDVDPRSDPMLCSLVSDKSLAIAGGVLEAVLMGMRDNG
jgi:xanthine dehydrogenase accessory factor